MPFKPMRVSFPPAPLRLSFPLPTTRTLLLSSPVKVTVVVRGPYWSEICGM